MARPSTGTVQWTGARWRARITLEDGSRPWVDLPESIGEREVEKARAKAREFAAFAREHGYRRTPKGPLVGDAETVREYLARWVAERERRGLRSVKDDRQRMTSHILPLVGDMPIRTITAKDCRAVVAALDAKVTTGVIAWRTALNVWGAFSKMMGDSCGSKSEALRVREDDPTSGVAAPDRGTERSKSYLYPSELLALLSCERVPLRWRRIYALAVYTYTRAGELEALAVGDVDLTRGVLHVHAATDRETGEARETKTKHARRLPIEPTLRPLLEAITAGRDPGERVVRMPPREDGAAHLRKHLLVAGVARAELYADDATRTPLTFHDLRATGITWRAVRGDEPLKIQRSAGHTDLNTTQRYIREAENLREGFGDVFPVLPRSLLLGGPGDPPDGGHGPTGEGEKHSGPGVDSSCESSNEADVLPESLTLSGPLLAIPTGFESASTRSTASNTGRNRGLVRLPRRRVHPDSNRIVTPSDDCGTDRDEHPGARAARPSRDTGPGALATDRRDAQATTSRGRLALALSEAVRAGLETGDVLLVALAARALAELVGAKG